MISTLWPTSGIHCIPLSSLKIKIHISIHFRQEWNILQISPFCLGRPTPMWHTRSAPSSARKPPSMRDRQDVLLSESSIYGTERSIDNAPIKTATKQCLWLCLLLALVQLSGFQHDITRSAGYESAVWDVYTAVGSSHKSQHDINRSQRDSDDILFCQIIAPALPGNIDLINFTLVPTRVHRLALQPPIRAPPTSPPPQVSIA